MKMKLIKGDSLEISDDTPKYNSQWLPLNFMDERRLTVNWHIKKSKNVVLQVTKWFRLINLLNCLNKVLINLTVRQAHKLEGAWNHQIIECTKFFILPPTSFLWVLSTFKLHFRFSGLFIFIKKTVY